MIEQISETPGQTAEAREMVLGNGIRRLDRKRPRQVQAHVPTMEAPVVEGVNRWDREGLVIVPAWQASTTEHPQVEGIVVHPGATELVAPQVSTATIPSVDSDRGGVRQGGEDGENSASDTRNEPVVTRTQLEEQVRQMVDRFFLMTRHMTVGSAQPTESSDDPPPVYA